MKAKETRKNLIDELNTLFSNVGGSFATLETHDASTSKKPKMFEANFSSEEVGVDTSIAQQTIKGLGFKNKPISTSSKETQEIYIMKDLIKSNPETMQTIPYDPKVLKTQMALVKRKEWQDMLFEDIDWFKKIDLTSGIKKIFKL